MNKNERLEILKQIFETGEEIEALEVMHVLSVDTATLAEDFKELIDAGSLIQVRPGIYKKQFDKRTYLLQPLALREKKYYDPFFLDSYTPNETFLWTQEEKKSLLDIQANWSFSFNYHTHLEQIENFLYDFTEFCAILNHSPYNRKDIIILLRHWVWSPWASFSETQYINNYWKAFDYVRDNYSNSFLHQYDFENISRIICEKRIADTELGRLRSFVLEFKEVSYTPLSDNNKLELEYELCLAKIKSIEDPFEKMLFIIVYLSYILPFSDGNKELTYFMANIPLLKSWYIPLCLYDVDMDELQLAYKELYEFCECNILKKLLINTYEKNSKRYAL